MKNPLLFATLSTACLFLAPALCLAQDNAPPATPAVAPALSPNAKAEKYRATAEAGDALAQAMLADALYYGIPSDAAFEEAATWEETPKPWSSWSDGSTIVMLLTNRTARGSWTS